MSSSELCLRTPTYLVTAVYMSPPRWLPPPLSAYTFLGNESLPADLRACVNPPATRRLSHSARPKRWQLISSTKSPSCSPDCAPLVLASEGRICQERCDCAACGGCTLTARRWRTPSGAVLQSIATKTSPSFEFAFKPDDQDMDKMKVGLVVEPVLTHAWHEAVLGCCGRGGAVVDVGGNYGWFSLFSLALGCRVTVFEPVPDFLEAGRALVQPCTPCTTASVSPAPNTPQVLGLGLALNPGFATRATVHPLLVHDGPPKNFSIRVPTGSRRKTNAKLQLGITATHGPLDARTPLRHPSSSTFGRRWWGRMVRSSSATSGSSPARCSGAARGSTTWWMGRTRSASSRRALEQETRPTVAARLTCVSFPRLKADVEGYEPQVLHSARRLFARHRPRAVQIELTQTDDAPPQRCEAPRLLHCHSDLATHLCSSPA